MKSIPPTPDTDAGRPGHDLALDGLRGCAILLVMVFHFCLLHRDFRGPDSGIFLQLAQLGWMGVDLFFVLSGFLITRILVKTRTQEHYFRNFLARRFLRIWPLYYLSLFVLLVALPVVMPTVPRELQGMQAKQIWFWLCGTNWLFAMEGGFGRTAGGYFWSLAVEDQFYLVWPFVVYTLSSRMLLRTCIGLMCFSLLARVVLASQGVGSGALYNMTFTHLDGLAAGSGLAVCLASVELTSRVKRLMPWAVSGAFAGLLAVRLADPDFFFWNRNMAVYGFTLIVLLFSALLVHVVCSRPGSGLNRFMSHGALTNCGKYSYALYLVHVPVSVVLIPLAFRWLNGAKLALGYDMAFVVGSLASFAVSGGLAVASWHLIEKRALALKRHFTGPPAAVAQGVLKPEMQQL